MTKKQDDAAADLLIREVDEDLRQDRMQQLWKRYGILVTGGAVAIVLAVIAGQAYTAWETDQRLESSARFASAQAMIEQSSFENAATELALLAGEGSPGYRVLALFEQANLHMRQGEIERSLAAYDRVAGDSGIDQIYRDMARLKAAYLRLDRDDPGAVSSSVAQLAQANSPWRHSAREIQALAALKQGDRARAGELLRQVAEDGAAPQGLRGRASEMLATIGGNTKG